MGILRYLVGVLQLFDRCPGDIWSVSWSYLIGVLEIFDWLPRHIYVDFPLHVYDEFP